MTDEKQLAADALRNAPSFSAAIEAVRSDILKTLSDISITERETILAHHAKLWLLRDVEGALVRIIINGQHAELVDNLPGQ